MTYVVYQLTILFTCGTLQGCSPNSAWGGFHQASGATSALARAAGLKDCKAAGIVWMTPEANPVVAVRGTSCTKVGEWVE